MLMELPRKSVQVERTPRGPFGIQYYVKEKELPVDMRKTRKCGILKLKDIPGGAEVKICLPVQGTWVPSLVGEPRSHDAVG